MAIVIFVAILFVVVIIHELGHFLMAKRAKMGVEEFGFGLPPRLWGKKIGKTIYSINWLPFGGFVRIAGEDDTGEASRRPDSFGQKSILARISVVVAGVFSNFMLAVVIFYFVLAVVGFKLTLPQIIPHNFVFVDQSTKLLVIDGNSDLNQGDVILSAGGSQVDSEDALSDIIIGKNTSLSVENSINNVSRQVAVDLTENVVITAVSPESAASDAGFEANDVILQIEGEPVKNVNEAQKIIKNTGEVEIAVLVKRGEENRELLVTPKLQKETGTYLIGVGLARKYVDKSGDEVIFAPAYYLNYNSLGQKLASGFTYSYNTLVYTGKIFSNLIGFAVSERTIEPVSEGVSGPVGIFSLVRDVSAFGLLPILQLVALLSLNLAVINILPIPAVDGGRLVFILFEAVTRKKVPANVEKWIHTGGFVFLIGLILLVTYNDILKLLR